MKLEFSRQILQRNSLSFIKIRLVGADLFHTDRWKDEQTDMTKLRVSFRSFANAPDTKAVYKNKLFKHKITQRLLALV